MSQEPTPLLPLDVPPTPEERPARPVIKISRGPGVVVAIALAYLALDKAGVSAPGSTVFDRLVDDPTVFFVMRWSAVLILVSMVVLALVLAAWLTRTVVHWMTAKLHARSVAGFEPDIARGAREVEEVVAVYRGAISKLTDNQATLVVALERTSVKLAAVEAELRALQSGRLI